MLGRLESRKNPAAGMRAFQRLWAESADAGLTLIGAPEKDAREEQALVRELAGHERFRHFEHLPDAGVREILSQARAMLFPSQGEGYGIPPMEALHAGIPVIVWAGLPALEGMPAHGQIRLPEITPERIADAVRILLDDAAAARLWAEAAAMPTPTWRDFASAVAEWITASAPVPAPP
jgi:glycosyltransferase involved in cell wall biosynthesis